MWHACKARTTTSRVQFASRFLFTAAYKKPSQRDTKNAAIVFVYFPNTITLHAFYLIIRFHFCFVHVHIDLPAPAKRGPQGEKVKDLKANFENKGMFNYTCFRQYTMRVI